MSRNDESPAIAAKDRSKKKSRTSNDASEDVLPASDAEEKPRAPADEENSSVSSDDMHLIRLMLEYTATLSVQDEKILRKICKYSRKEDSRSIALRTPVLFGRSLASTIKSIASNAPVAGSSAAMNGKKRKKKKQADPGSITDEEIRSYVRNARSKEPSFIQIFSSFDRHKLMNTISHFPRDLCLNPRKKVKNQLTLGERDYLNSEANRSSILDPRFVLVELWHLVSDSVLLNCQDFIRSKALSLVIVALSSNNESIRRVSYCILQRFYRQLESSLTIYLEARFWLWFIDSFRAYLTVEPNHQISGLMASFFACSLDILTNPTNILFATIREFFTNNFTRINARTVAIKLRSLFHSTHILHYRGHFGFATKVMRFGLVGLNDLRALQKQQLFDWMMLSAHSRVTSKEEIRAILLVIESAVSISPQSVKKLCSQSNLLNFILQVTLLHAKGGVSSEEKTDAQEDEDASHGDVSLSDRKKAKTSSVVTSETIIDLLEQIVNRMVSHFTFQDATVTAEASEALEPSDYSPQVRSILTSLQILRFIIYSNDKEEQGKVDDSTSQSIVMIKA